MDYRKSQAADPANAPRDFEALKINMKKLSPGTRSLITIILMLFSIFWIALTLWDSIDQLPVSLGALRTDHLAMAGIPAILSVVISAYMYYLVLSGIVPLKTSFYNIAQPFFAAQAVRYLPGRIWGTFYLAQATTGYIPARYAVRANIVHFFLATFNSIAVAISVYAYYREGKIFALTTYAGLLFIVYLVLKADFLQIAAAVISRDREYRRCNTRKEPLLLGLLQADWLVYFIACALILPGSFSLGDSLIIATSYAIAWIAGAFAFMLPGGLFVREGSFLWLSSLFGFSPADMFLFSIVARILFTLSDVACAGLSIVLMRGNKDVC